jgi:hypothetical protein
MQLLRTIVRKSQPIIKQKFTENPILNPIQHLN